MYVNLCCTAECLGYIYTHIYTDILFHILFHYGVSQEVESSSSSGTAGPCFSLLYTVYPFASANPKRPLRPSAALHPPWQPQVSSLVCEPVSDSEIGSTWKRGRAASAFLCLASLARCGHLWVPPAPAPLRSAALVALVRRLPRPRTPRPVIAALRTVGCCAPCCSNFNQNSSRGD